MKNTWRFKGNEFKYIKEVIDSGEGSGRFGNMNNRFEQAFAEKCGAEYAIAFNSGTGTMHAGLAALDVNAGDEVIVPPLTVIANISVIFAQNAVPVFADINPETFNVDPEDIKRKITSKTKCIMPVSLYGLSADLDPIMQIAKENNIGVINDAAEAHGTLYKGKKIAEIADITSFSTENSKHITTGDGGIVVTNNPEYATLMRKFGSLGYAVMQSNTGKIMNKDIFQDPGYKRHDTLGLNYRMPEIAAAIGLAQTERYEYFIDLRIKIAEIYRKAIEGCDFIVPQKIPKGYNNTYWTFTVKYEHETVSWKEFREKFVELGGDGIYAAWSLSYIETVMYSEIYKKRAPEYFNHLKYPIGTCPIAESIQPKIMQFVTNYGTLEEATIQSEVLEKTIKYFS